MIEKAATSVEAVSRAALAVVALGVNIGVVWYFYGKDIKAWWSAHVAGWFRRQWEARWNRQWSIDAHGTAADG